MVEVASGAERYLGFDMVGAATVGVMNGTGAKTEVDIVGGETELLLGVERGLIKAKLSLRVVLDFI